MNFVGHAIAAARVCDDPAFVLGSMLPDLAKMAACRITAPLDRNVAAGIAHHHAVDAKFHALDSFMSLCRDGREALEQRGLHRGAAMAVAHVGIELLLDGSWSRTVRGPVPLAEALAVDPQSFIPDAPAQLRFEQLCAVLRGRDLVADYSSTAEVARRLVRILAPRPRLALQVQHEATVAAWLVHVRPMVVEHSLAWLDAVA